MQSRLHPHTVGAQRLIPYLMSVTNAISSIIVIGALIQVSSEVPAIKWIAIATLLITSINIAGGFAVTRRMLDMFRK